MFHPLIIVTFGIVFAGMRSTAFCAGVGSVYRDRSLHNEIVKLQRFNEIGVPHQGAVRHFDIIGGAPNFGDGFDTRR